MKKYDLLMNEDTIIRVLKIISDRVLMIDCIKKTIPTWVALSALNSFTGCTGDELCEITGVTVIDIDTLGTLNRSRGWA